MRRFISTMLFAAVAVVAVLAARPATVVLNNGERVSGQLTYQNGNDIRLNERSIPFSDIAIIAFQPGDPNAAELHQLPRGSAELERHMVMLTNGSVIIGKLHGFSADGETMTFDPREGGMGARREIPASQIARVYLNVPAARSVYHNVLNPPAPVAVPAAPVPAVVGTSGVATPGSIAVNANQPWTDTGITVKKGDRVSFNANGTIQIATGGAASTAATPDGVSGAGAAGPGKPVPVMATGGLIGRIGNGAAFPIGANTQPITMPAAGRLYVGVNDDNFSDNSGVFYVVVTKQ